MAIDQKTPAVPGIPLAALDAIADQNVRQVLQALVDAHHVRNGNAGNGDNRFITAAEAGLTGGRSVIVVQGGSQGSTSGGSLIKPSDIARIINDLQALVIESPLFKALGERVDLIDKPGGIFTRLGNVEIVTTNEIQTRQTADEAEIQARTALGVRVGAAEGAIVTETNLRTNADNSIIQTITTQYAAVNQNLALVQQSITTVTNTVSSQATQLSQVQASVGSNSTAIQQESTARVQADGVINAKYTIKIDSNGYVSGYGLMSTANNSTPFSEFIVRADRFAIGSPSGPGIAPQIPFIVLTTPTVVGGQTVPPGVYIDSAFIKNGSIGNAQIADAAITTAKIGDAQVNTLKIGANAVTVPAFVNGYGGASGVTPGGDRYIGSVTVSYPDTVDVAIIANWQSQDPSSSAGNTGFKVIVDGGVVMYWSDSSPKGLASSHSASSKVRLGAGGHTFLFYVNNNWSSGSWDLTNWSVLLLGVMR